MKKTSLYVISLLVVLFVGINSAYAVDLAGLNTQNRTDMNYTTDENTNVTTIKLVRDSDAGIEVRSGQTVVLDLNDHKLTNYCAKNGKETVCTGSSSVIDVEEGGNLTIIDTGTQKKGSITYKDETENIVAINNKGTLVIEAGNITGNASISTDNKAYSVVLNQGTMEVNGGTITSSSGNKAAVIHNLGTITVTGGEIKTGVEESWGLLNYGTATINGGTFTQGYKYSVVQNSGDMTIANGNFKTENGGVHYALITNENVYGTEEGNAELTINGGTFTSNIVLSYGTSKKGEAVINGGTFDTTQVLDGVIAPDSELGENGQIVKKELHNVKLNNVDNATVEVDEESTYEGDTVTVSVEPKDGYKLDEIIVKTADGTQIEVVDGKFVMPNEDVTVDVILKEVVAEDIPETETTPEETIPEENPNTLDSIVVYVATGLVASFGVAGLSYYLIRRKQY